MSLIIVSSLFFGWLLGILTFALLIAYQVRKLDKKSKKSVEQQIKEMEKQLEVIGKVKALFSEASEATEEQMSLVAQIERPSASASHSRYKNDIIQRIKSLETRKLEIFQEILDTGLDPVISIMSDGEPKEVKMSEALALRKAEDDDFTPPSKTDSNNPQGNVSHLKLVKKEELDDDGKSTNSDPTLH